MTTIDGGLLAIPFKNSEVQYLDFIKEKKNRKFLRTLFGLEVDDYFSRNPKARQIPEECFADAVFKELKNEWVSMDIQSFKKFWMDWQNAESIRRRRWFGIAKDERVEKYSKGFSDYPTFEVGGKFHANNVNAIIGLNALKSFDEWIDRRKQIIERYDKELCSTVGIELLEKKKDRQSGNWLYTILVDKRSDFIIKMLQLGIETSIVHERNDVAPIFREYAGDCPNLRKVNNKRVCLPLHQNMTLEDANYIIKSIKGGW
ncbi:unnamed protein product [marine sediment metagenome]|uniref:DegT/DnrJ/EryC1/StrS aminotransferase family protein n=1 Tax=marine sediment metagenome TaxID=412755 RepID=X1G2U0_9ZZZZ